MLLGLVALNKAYPDPEVDDSATLRIIHIYAEAPTYTWTRHINNSLSRRTGNWNEVLWPLIVIRKEAWMTMPQMVALFSVGGGSHGKLGPQLAAALLLGLPIIVAYLFFQRHFISSLASSGLKG